MTELPSTPPATSNRSMMIALIVMGLTVIALVIALLITQTGKDDAVAPTPTHTGAPAQPGGQASPNGQSTPGDSTATPAELPALDPQVKALVEGKWRKSEDDPMAVGKVDAGVVVQIYYDFRCGYCAMGAVETEPKLKHYLDDGTIRIEYHNLPVLGPDSVMLAQASVAAGNQGKFLDFHSFVFQHQYDKDPVSATEDGLVEVAKQIGVPDLEKFRADMLAQETVDAVEAARVEGTQRLGITGTPAFIVGYSYIPGFIPAETMDQVIAAELARPAA
ncbi:DsbA family protein [Trueperella pecoris]|uniref:DsbA family protein n=1 Tax=Trueperella pecoris TaxID=2733571 RepID=UPI00186B8FAE|nr:thioredoxin domain-containing protein [Trueperella pecoris]QOQ39741.1 thioredoxin domain-containing protein [Trueperella pecoris]